MAHGELDADKVRGFVTHHESGIDLLPAPLRPEDAELVTMSPHMHYRGKDFKFTLIRPDGSREVILNVPKYDFNWQNAYVLARPVPLREGEGERLPAARKPAQPVEPSTFPHNQLRRTRPCRPSLRRPCGLVLPR